MRLRRGSLLLIAFAGLTLGGCQAGVESFCAQRLPQFEQALAQASTDLPQVPAMAAVQGRAPASAQPAPTLEEEQREHWRDWTQDRLEEIQAALDLAADYPELAGVRRDLSLAADRAVTLYGYSMSGNPRKMRESLDNLQASVTLIKLKVCQAPAR